MYEYIKSLHLIFIVTWFAGLFYLVRLFIYHTEAQEKEPLERDILSKQFKIMEKRLWYGITWPSAVFVALFGFYMVKNYWPWADHNWLLVKLGFVFGLYGYHYACGKMFQNLQKNNFKYSSYFLRIWNEVATLFLFAIVFLVCVKSELAFIPAISGLIIFALVLMLAIRLYRRMRELN